MAFTAGVCPNCNEYLLLKNGVPFLVCPLCAESISAREAGSLMDSNLADSKSLNENIAKCLELEKKYGPELPFQILTILSKHFPYNEEIAYLVIKMSGYDSLSVKYYLVNFAATKKPVSFARDFLENALIYENMAWADLFEQYIQNKLAGSEQRKWLEKLREMRSIYKVKPGQKAATGFLYSFYIISSLINIALAVVMLFISLHIVFSVLIVVAALCIEVLILFFHNKKYGDRLDISETERAMTVTFMCSIIIAVGGVFLGAIITI